MAGLSLGVDIGGTKTQWMVFDASFNVIAQHYVKTPVLPAAGWLCWLQQLLSPVLAAYPIQGIGIALPGIFSTEGVLQAVNLPSVHQRITHHELQALWSIPIMLGNDCRLAALAEAKLGAAKHCERVLSIRVGTGLGAGFCWRGVLYQGAHQQSCELGHQGLAAAVLVKWQLPLWSCNCGQLGCVEQYASGRGLLKLFQHFLQHSTEPTLPQWQQAFHRGDNAAKQSLDCWLDCLAALVNQQVLAFDPDCVLLSGGVFASEIQVSALVARIQQRFLTGWALPEFRQAQLLNSSCVGAALMVHEHYALDTTALGDST